MIDVCLMLEGTYPYVSGGVSTWVHQLISSMKHLRFGILYIAPFSDPTRKLKYDVPPQVIYLKEINLHDYELQVPTYRNPKSADFEKIKTFYEDVLIREKIDGFEEFLGLFRGDRACFSGEEILKSKGIWKILVDFYNHYIGDVSYIDYFWTWRGTHLPLLQILQAQIPKASIYHAISTGYAGLLGSVAKATHGGKLFITEHGIYTHERMLEIVQADWLYEEFRSSFRVNKDLSFFKQWWIELFRVMSKIAYKHSDRIFTLYEGNKVREVLDGADPKKITIIPNGLDLKSVPEHKKQKRPSPQIGFIGRVVTIKDVKTFIQAAKIVVDKIPEAQFYILGPTDEEPEYNEECVKLVDALGLDSNLKFTGKVNVREYYDFLDIVVLTSISEAQPYVILEANSVGIPVVTTDVGACREMIEGNTPGDRALGAGGFVTSVANPQETAEAIIRLVSDKKIYGSMSEAGIARVKMFYDQDDLLSRYLNVYEQNL